MISGPRMRVLMQRRQMIGVTNAPGAVYLAWGAVDLVTTVYANRAIYGASPGDLSVAELVNARPDATFVVADPTVWPFLSRWPLESEERPTFAIADFGSHPYPYDGWRAFAAHADVTTPLTAFFTDGQPVAVQRGGRWRDPDGSHQRAADPDTNRPDNRTTIPRRQTWWARTVYPWWCDEVAARGWTQIVTRHFWNGNVLHWASVVGD